MEWGPERSRLQVIRAEHLRKQRRKFKYVKLFSFRQKEKVRTANGHLARLIN